jgi:hypothetical protein
MGPRGLVIEILRVWIADKNYHWYEYCDFADESHNLKYIQN